MFFNDLVTVNILVELLVTKVIGGFKLKNGRVSKKSGNFVGRVEDGLDNGLNIALEMKLEIFLSFARAFHCEQSL